MDESSGHQPPSGTGFFASVRRLGMTRTDDRWVGGVCAGIGHRYGLDPLLVRGLLVVTGIFLGIGTVAYGLAWALLPEARDGRIHLEEAGHGRFDIALAGAGALVLTGFTQGTWWWGGTTAWTVLWLVVTANVILVLVLSNRDRRGHRGPPSPTGDESPVGSTGPYDAAGRPAVPAIDWRQTMTPQSGPPPTPPPGSTGPPPPHGPAPTGPGMSGGPVPPDAAPPTGPPGTVATTQAVRPPRGSRTTVLVALGLCLLAASGVLLAQQAGLLDAPALVLIGGISLAILGTALIISGARGRPQGGLGVLGFFVAIVIVPGALVVTSAPGLGQVFGPTGMLLGDFTFAPTSTADAADGYTIGVGDLDVDLTALDLTKDEDLDVKVGVGVGELVVLVPDDWDVTVDAQARVGDISGALRGWQREDAHGTSSIVQHRRTTLGSGTNVAILLHQQRDDAPTVYIDAHVGIGDITIEEQR